MGTIKYYTIKSGDTLSLIVQKNPDLGYKTWKELLNANLDEIMRVGREKMAAIGVGPTVTRKPCGLSGHGGNASKNHEIINGVHWDEPNVPTIYPDTVLRLQSNPALDPKPKPVTVKPKPKPAPEPEKPEKVFTAEIIEGKPWEGLESQAPGPILEVYIKGNPNTPDITYSADAKDYSKLLAYNFTESVDDLEGSFSFTVENEEVGGPDGETVFDIIPVRSVIKIYEGDIPPVFVGIIRRRKNSVSITAQGPKRSITFSGKSIISCVAEYAVSLDVRIQNVADAMTKTKQLEVELAKKKISIEEFIEITWRYFQKVSVEANGASNTAIAEVIDKFIGKVGDFVTVWGKEQKIGYDIAAVFFNQSNNTIADIWRNILPKPAYELFSYCAKDGKPKVMVRLAPFGDPDNGNYDWKNLDRYLITPISLTSYELEQSDEEVYTFFASYLIGSAMSREFYLAVNQTGKDELVSKNPEKVAIYGFRPLEINFNGYDRQGNTKNQAAGTLQENFKKLNKRAEYWYSRLDDMYSGSITVCTDFNRPKTNPRVGCRAKFIGGEFYITKTEHSWNYGGTPFIKCAFSRGMLYDGNGKQSGILKNVGRRFRELER